MTRVLHVVSSLKKNGTETFIMNVLRHIDRNKFKFDFLTFNEDKEGYYDEIISYGCKVYFLPGRKKGFLDYHKRLKEFFRDKGKEYEVVHQHDMSLTSLAPLYYARKSGIGKRLIHIHGSNCKGLHNRLFHRLNKLRISGVATHYLSCSQEASAWGYKSTGVYGHSEVVVNGIDLKNFYFKPERRIKLREYLGIKESDKVILHIGGFNIIKNQGFILEILEALKNEELPRIKMLFVGEGPMQEEIKRESKEKGLNDIVKFLGHRDDVGDIISASDILVFPSFHEGLGLVVIESQAGGLPVLVSEGVPREACVTSQSYRMSLQAGAGKWAEKIKQILLETVEREADRSLQGYSIEKTVEALSQMYQ